MSDDLLPSEEPDLADVWPDMSPEERLRYQMAEGEDRPAEVSERSRQVFQGRSE